MLLALTFLADVGADAFTGKLVLGVCSIGGTLAAVILGILGYVQSRRRQPPIEEEMHKSFVRREEWEKSITDILNRMEHTSRSQAGLVPREELTDSVQRVHERVDETHEKIDGLRNVMAKGFQDVERAIGRLEGKR